MSVVPAEDLLLAGAAKLKRLWLQVGQLFNPARLISRIPSTVGATRCQPNGASNDQRQRKCRRLRGGAADLEHRRRSA
jgi:hypothetical protein